MAKVDIAAALDRARAAVAELESEIAALTSKRQARLLAGDPPAAIAKLDSEIASSRHAEQTERDRIALLSAERERELSAERLGRRLEKVESVELIFQRHAGHARDLVAAIEAVDKAYHALLNTAAEARAAYPFKLIDCGPLLIGDTAIADATAAQMWKTLGRAPVTGGLPSGPDNFQFPNLKAPSFQALGRPEGMESFLTIMERGVALASSIMRQNKTTGAPDPAPAGGNKDRMQWLIGEQMRLAEMNQLDPEVERQYNAVIAEMETHPLEEAAA